MTKRVSRLSDGRELIYFDDAGRALPAERRADTRPPQPRPPTPELRLDPLTGEWISVATARQNRVFLPSAEADPLAPARPGHPTEIPDEYDVAVFENRSPSYGPGLPPPGQEPDTGQGSEPGQGPDPGPQDRIGLGRTRPGYGRCEVVCFDPRPIASWGDLTETRARTIVEAWADRTARLSELPGVRQVYVFENRGREIGVTLHHPHGQIYAYPFVTPRTKSLLRSIESYGPGLMADILDFERNSPRVLIRGEHFTVFVPFAARWPVEVHMLANRHVPDLAATTGAERDEIGYLYRRIARAIDLLYDTPTAYIGAWHQAPVDAGRDTVRLMLQVTSPRRAADKLKYLAGSETGMGAFVGDISPEDSAEQIRAALSALPD
ncbi:MAG: galactose-1-phosphate uridylyltransferase [Nocardiopsaceae bacterium]|nr:galactose-1-phosphate uridylyltransferase [Nocardiopsaceae bacterium]